MSSGDPLSETQSWPRGGTSIDVSYNVRRRSSHRGRLPIEATARKHHNRSLSLTESCLYYSTEYDERRLGCNKTPLPRPFSINIRSCFKNRNRDAAFKSSQGTNHRRLQLWTKHFNLIGWIGYSFHPYYWCQGHPDTVSTSELCIVVLLCPTWISQI